MAKTPAATTKPAPKKSTAKKPPMSPAPDVSGRLQALEATASEILTRLDAIQRLLSAIQGPERPAVRNASLSSTPRRAL